ncbi:polysulfide reductase NrfD [Candidatus Poribacteria bacterium]|nr:polysulfide reductase NrfD [Candidatus Poribacteria bacterium]
MDRFIVEAKRNKEWNFPVALSFSSEGIGAALFALGVGANSRTGMIAGLLFVFIGAFALFLDLGHPSRFWRVISNTTKAWMSRGAVSMSALILLGGVSIAPAVSISDGLSATVRFVALISSLFVMLYGGFLLASMTSIRLWKTLWIPILFLAHSMTSAIVIFAGISALAPGGGGMDPRYRVAAMASMFGCLVVSLAYIWAMSSSNVSTVASRESVRLLIRGDSMPFFVGGGLVCGIILPLVITAVFHPGSSASGGAASLLFLIAAIVLRAGGDVSFRYSLLKAGTYEPPL